MDLLAILLGKLVFFFSTTLGFGAGATWPGEVTLRVNPHILPHLVSGLTKGVILVAGTNGKTTTALMVKQILEKNGDTVIHNASGANLDNGLVSALVNTASWGGLVKADWAVFEVDENTLPVILESIHPKIIILLNLFRDQLDRYGEVDVIAQKWQKAISKLTQNTHVVVNADDPLIAHLGLHANLPVTYFGVNDKSQFLSKMEHATDSIFCLNCGGRLTYEGIYYSHIGIWRCTRCKEKRPSFTLSAWESPLPGLYNIYNTLAAVTATKEVGYKDQDIRESLKNFRPAFGRQEEFEVGGRKIKIFLSKNPAGFNQSLKTVLELGAKNLLLILNDRIPDGLDVSWIWDVDFEMIPKDILVRVSGDRAYDLALRLKYASIKATTYERLENSLESDRDLYVLATYTGMLEVRKILKGRKIL